MSREAERHLLPAPPVIGAIGTPVEQLFASRDLPTDPDVTTRIREPRLQIVRPVETVYRTPRPEPIAFRYAGNTADVFGIKLPTTERRKKGPETGPTLFPSTKTEQIAVRDAALAWDMGKQALFEGTADSTKRITDEMAAALGWNVVRINCADQSPIAIGRAQSAARKLAEGQEETIEKPTVELDEKPQKTMLVLEGLNQAHPDQIGRIKDALEHLREHSKDPNPYTILHKGQVREVLNEDVKVVATVDPRHPNFGHMPFDPTLQAEFLHINTTPAPEEPTAVIAPSPWAQQLAGEAPREIDRGVARIFRRDEPLTDDQLMDQFGKFFGGPDEEVLQRLDGFSRRVEEQQSVAIAASAKKSPLSPLAPEQTVKNAVNTLKNYETDGDFTNLLTTVLGIHLADALPPEKKGGVTQVINELKRRKPLYGEPPVVEQPVFPDPAQQPRQSRFGVAGQVLRDLSQSGVFWLITLGIPEAFIVKQCSGK